MRTILTFMMLVTAGWAADLTVYHDSLLDDQWNVMLRESLITPLDELQARQPAAIEYIAEMRALRERVQVKVLSLDEARLPGGTPTPSYAFGTDDPRSIRKDALYHPLLVLQHLDYLLKLYVYDSQQLGWRQSNDSITRWILFKKETAIFHDGDVSTQVDLIHWFPAVEPVPAPDLHYKWTRTITIKERGEAVEESRVVFEGSPEMDILRAMDSETGIVLRAVDTAARNKAQRVSNWINQLPGQKQPQMGPPAPCPDCP